MRIKTMAPDRKALAKALAEHLGAKSIYHGPPIFAYTIGDVTVDREGAIILPDDMDPASIQGFLISKGWLKPEPDRLTISVPMEGMSVRTMLNLILMLYNKQYLLGKALKENTVRIDDSVILLLQQSTPETPAGFISLVDDLKAQGKIEGIDFTEDSVSLSFPLSDKPDITNAFTLLTVNILAAAKTAMRVNPERQQPENEKYYMRSWLVRLGFGGKEAKGMRDMLLKHLKGNSAFRSDLEAQKHREKYAEIRRSHKESAVQEAQHEEG